MTPRARRGLTLLELCVVVTLGALVGGVVARTLHAQRLAAARLAGSLRARTVLAQAAAALDAELRDVPAGDALVVLDSAVEVLTPLGAAVVCEASTAGLVLPAAAGDATLAWWSGTPRPGDVARVLRPDGAGGAWSEGTVVSVDEVPPAASCAALGDSSARPGRRIVLAALPVGAEPGAVVWVGRRLRYDLYRGGDGAWQLGRRECAGPAPAPCETVQPVAGPLFAYDADAVRTGFHVAQVNADGMPAAPGDAPGAAALRLTLRAPRRPGDRRPPAPAESLVLWLARRNRP